MVARLHLPADPSDRAAVAAAWPPDTLGFSNLDPQPPQQPDLWAPPAAPATSAAGATSAAAEVTSAAGGAGCETGVDRCDGAAKGGGGGDGGAAATLHSLSSGPLADADVSTAAAAAVHTDSAPSPEHGRDISSAAGRVGAPAGQHHTGSTSGSSPVHSHPLNHASPSPIHIHPAYPPHPSALHGAAGSGYLWKLHDTQQDREDGTHAAAWAGGSSSTHGVPATPGESFSSGSSQHGRRGMLAKMPGVQGSVMHNLHQSDAGHSAGKHQDMISPRAEQPE